MKPGRFLPFLMLLMLLALPACSALPAQLTGATPSPVTLKITVLPILEALPMYVAEKEGFYAAHGVQVQVLSAASAPERDQLIASGQADGTVNEMLSAIFNNKDQTQVEVVRYARAATSDAALFRIVASRQSGITTVAGLKGQPIGVSNGTIIEYLTDRLLQQEGFTPAEIKKVAVPKLSDRLALLASGKLPAAVLPEPQAELAIQQGGAVVLDDSRHPEYSFSTLTFRKTVIDQHPEAVRGFLAAWEDAVKKINANPDAYNDLLVQQNILPQALVSTFHTPRFVTAGVPNAAQFMDTLSWARQAGLISTDPAYDQTVNAAFLPQ